MNLTDYVKQLHIINIIINRVTETAKKEWEVPGLADGEWDKIVISPTHPRRVLIFKKLNYALWI